MTCAGDDSFEATLVIPHRLGDLEFRVEVTDSYGRTTTSDLWALPVHDNDPPVLGEDGSDGVGRSGRAFRFDVAASDNILVSKVEVAYWIRGDRRSLVLVEEGGSFIGEVVLPQVVGRLTYTFTVTDSSGLETEGGAVTVDVLDVDPPVISVEHPDIATTGDPFVVTCHVTDNIALSEVWMEWGVGGLTESQTIALAGGSPFQVAVAVPDVTGTLRLVVRARDASGNANSSAEAAVEVVDDDPPFLLEDLTGPTPSTGRDHAIVVRAGDNIGVSGVAATYGFDGGDPREGVLEPAGSLHSLSIHVPEDARTLEYHLTVVDPSGNVYTTAPVALEVVDVIPPALGGSGDLSVPTGETFTVTASGRDNRDRVDVAVHLRLPGGEWTSRAVGAGPSFDLIFTSVELDASTAGFCGAILFYIEASDASGNSASLGTADVPRRITVVDGEPPHVRLTGPSRCVTGETVVFDAGGSWDNVGTESFVWSVEGPDDLAWSGPVVETTFTRPGDYLVHLVVTDGSGNSATLDRHLVVEDAPEYDSSRVQLLSLVVVLGVFLAIMVMLRK